MHIAIRLLHIVIAFNATREVFEACGSKPLCGKGAAVASGGGAAGGGGLVCKLSSSGKSEGR